MIFRDGWYWPDSEKHMIEWLANPKNRVTLNGRVSYQGKKQQALLALCKRFRCAIDVGSHVGTWSYNLAKVFETVRAFEPIADHRACFAANVVASNVIVYPVALGDKPGSVEMYSGPHSSGDSWVKPGVRGDIDMVTLDSFHFDEVDCLKIDTEGFEESILRGAEQTLLRCKPVLCVEQKRDFAKKYGLQPQGAIPYLKSLGYVVAREIGGDYLLRCASI